MILKLLTTFPYFILVRNSSDVSVAPVTLLCIGQIDAYADKTNHDAIIIV